MVQQAGRVDMLWMTNNGGAEGAAGTRDLRQAVLRGMRLLCPHCGKGRLFSSFTTAVNACAVCGENMSAQQADDAPPYVVITIVGHILVAGALTLEKTLHPPLWVHFSLWIPLTILCGLLLLPPVKGAIIGFQWANRMHGFSHTSETTS